MNKKFKILIVGLVTYLIGINSVFAQECISCGGGALAIPKGIPFFVSNMIKLVQILVPVLLIIMGMVTFLRVIISGDEKVTKEATSTFIRNLILGVSVFLIVAIVRTVFTTVSKATGESALGCVSCFVDSESCKEVACKERDMGGNKNTNTNTHIETCFDYKDKETCESKTDRNGASCVWTNDKTCSTKAAVEAKDCNDFSSKNCPTVSPSGQQCHVNSSNNCVKVTGATAK